MDDHKKVQCPNCGQIVGWERHEGTAGLAWTREGPMLNDAAWDAVGKMAMAGLAARYPEELREIMENVRSMMLNSLMVGMNVGKP